MDSLFLYLYRPRHRRHFLGYIQTHSVFGRISKSLLYHLGNTTPPKIIIIKHVTKKRMRKKTQYIYIGTNRQHTH